MKSPAEIGLKLAKQWYRTSARIERLLGSGVWPLHLEVGVPTARTFTADTGAVQRHVETWRQVEIGFVKWEQTAYRAGSEPILLPTQWSLRAPSEWIEAMADAEIRREFHQLEYLVERTDAVFHSALVAQRTLWLKREPAEVIATAALASKLSPGCAHGRPLRLLAEHGVDTKFFERNSALLTKLLDERFKGEVSEQGLVTFLDAYEESSHWVLVVPLSPGILPFKRLRLTTTELAEVALPCSRVLVVENEQSMHQLPELPDTIAILGCGLDLQWLATPLLYGKSLGYWGDLDTWGLLMLARARLHQPSIEALLMTRPLFDRYSSTSAVAEPVKAQPMVPSGLSGDEGDLYRYLLSRELGRLEQEYIPREVVASTLVEWGKSSALRALPTL